MIRRTWLLWKVAAVGLCVTVAAEASTSGRYASPALPPTIRVAAFDTDPMGRQTAHFVCDGVGDQVEIQAAIDLLPVAGGTVRLLAGNYSVEENGTNRYCIIINRSNINFEFEAGAVVKLADNVYTSGETGHVFQVGSGLQAPPPLRRNITIWGPGTIDGNRANNAGGATTRANAGIHTQGQITDLTIGGGLNITQARGLALGLTGVRVAGDTYLLRCVRLVDLHLTDSGEGTLPNLIDGMMVDGLIIDNMIDQDGWEPIGVHNLVMTNSIMKNCQGSAADIFGGTGSANYGNIGHVYSNCIFGPTDKVTGDMVAIGVFTSQGTTPTENIIIQDCLVLMQNCFRGIAIGETGFGVTNTHSRHIVLSNVTIDGAGSTADSTGIYIGDFAEDVQVNSCVVFDSGSHGLQIAGQAAPNQPSGILVNGGRFFNNDQSGGATGSGIAVGQFTDFITIVGVECYDDQVTPTQDYGIDVTTNGSLSVMDCLFTGNGFRGLTISQGNVSVANCSFIGNGGPSEGGGILADGSSTIVGCTFIGNQADKGGALSTAVDPIVINCVFRDNFATESGGAVYNSNGADPTFLNCEFIGNNAVLAGGAIFNSRSNAMFINCTVSGSTAGLGGAMFNEDFSFPIVTNSVFWDNSLGQFFDGDSLTSARYSNIQGGWPGIGNIDADPMFVDPASGNYRLLSGSPCIDAGNNWSVASDLADLDADGDTSEFTPLDFDGNPRFADDPATTDAGCGVPVIVDMGAYEFQGAPATVKLGDIDGDGAIAVPDLLTLLAAWGPVGGGCQLADFDLDDLVGVPDLLILLANWG